MRASYHGRQCKNCGGTLKYLSTSSCVVCVIKYGAAWQLKNKARLQELRLRRRYGIDPGTYDILLKLQNGRCAVCEREPLEHRRMHVDHDHKTGSVRGLICRRCNVGIGYFKDSPDFLQRAADYLRNAHGQSNEQRALARAQ